MEDGPALYVCDTLSTATQSWPRGPFGFVGFSFSTMLATLTISSLDYFWVGSS